MRWSAHESRGLFDTWLASVDMGFATYLDGDLVGHTSFLNDRPDDRVVEIGNTWLNSAAWGTGANTEAKFLLLQHAFEDEGYLRVEFKTDAANERSRAALAKFASFEGVARKHMLVRGGARRDSAWYAVIDDDWPEARSVLRDRLARDARNA